MKLRERKSETEARTRSEKDAHAELEHATTRLLEVRQQYADSETAVKAAEAEEAQAKALVADEFLGVVEPNEAARHRRDAELQAIEARRERDRLRELETFGTARCRDLVDQIIDSRRDRIYAEDRTLEAEQAALASRVAEIDFIRQTLAAKDADREDERLELLSGFMPGAHANLHNRKAQRAARRDETAQERDTRREQEAAVVENVQAPWGSAYVRIPSGGSPARLPDSFQ